MKYLDNLLAWGDSLFRQDTIESMNEATQVYVLAANLLGPKPQPVPPRGEPRAHELRPAQGGRHRRVRQRARRDGERVPVRQPRRRRRRVTPGSSAAFGIGRTLYFCIPPNDKLLVVLGPGRRPAVQDPPLHEHRGRRPPAGAVRPADRPRRARARRPPPASTSPASSTTSTSRCRRCAARCCCRRRRSCATR